MLLVLTHMQSNALGLESELRACGQGLAYLGVYQQALQGQRGTAQEHLLLAGHGIAAAQAAGQCCRHCLRPGAVVPKLYARICAGECCEGGRVQEQGQHLLVVELRAEGLGLQGADSVTTAAKESS